MTSEATATARAGAEPRPIRQGPRLTGGPNRRFEIAPHNCFACGQLNVNGMHLDLHTASGRCWTELSLPRRFEGWEGIAHGGIVVTILDEVMAWALVDHDLWGVTARMSVDFKRPVPIGVPIRAEGWVLAARRRLVDTAAEIRDPSTGMVLATAVGRYVAASDDRKRALQARYLVRLVDEEEGLPGGTVAPHREADPPDTGVSR